MEYWADDESPVASTSTSQFGSSAVDSPMQPTTSTGSGGAWIPRRVEMDMELDAAEAALNSVHMLGRISDADYAGMCDALSRCRVAYTAYHRARFDEDDDDDRFYDQERDLLLDDPDILFVERQTSAIETACLRFLMRRYDHTAPPQVLSDGDIGWPNYPEFSLSRDVLPTLRTWGLE